MVSVLCNLDAHYNLGEFTYINALPDYTYLCLLVVLHVEACLETPVKLQEFCFMVQAPTVKGGARISWIQAFIDVLQDLSVIFFIKH